MDSVRAPKHSFSNQNIAEHYLSTRPRSHDVKNDNPIQKRTPKCLFSFAAYIVYVCAPLSCPSDHMRYAPAFERLLDNAYFQSLARHSLGTHRSPLGNSTVGCWRTRRMRSRTAGPPVPQSPAAAEDGGSTASSCAGCTRPFTCAASSQPKCYARM